MSEVESANDSAIRRNALTFFWTERSRARDPQSQRNHWYDGYYPRSAHT